MAQPQSPSTVGSPTSPRQPRVVITRTQRRRPSFGGVPSCPQAQAQPAGTIQSLAGAAAAAVGGYHTLRPEIFERLWSAHAVPASWARSFIPVTRTMVSAAERCRLRAAFDAATCASGATAGTTAAVAGQSGGDDGRIADHGVGFDTALDSPTQQQPGGGARGGGGGKDTLDRTIRIDRAGQATVRSIIAHGLRLTWLADAAAVLWLMRAAVASRTMGPDAAAEVMAGRDTAAAVAVAAPPPSVRPLAARSQDGNDKSGGRRPGPQDDIAIIGANDIVDTNAGHDADPQRLYPTFVEEELHASPAPPPAQQRRAPHMAASTTLVFEDVVHIANELVADASSRRPVTLDTALGQTAKSNDDSYATADEVLAAYEAMGGHPGDLAAPTAGVRATARALQDMGLDSEAVLDAAVTPSATATPDTRSVASSHRVRGSRRGSAVSEQPPMTGENETLPTPGNAAHALLLESEAAGHGDDTLYDDEQEDLLDFAEFESKLAPIDPWKATCARLFTTLGGDPANPESRAPIAPILAALRRMLAHELAPASVEAYLGRFEQLHEGSTGLSYEAFESTVVLPLRKVCSGDTADEIVRKGMKGGGGAQAGGSAGLMQLLTFTPKLGKQPLSSGQMLARLGAILREKRSSRQRYNRIRARTSTVFKTGCILAETPLSHVAPLTRRRLLFVVNLVTQRRTLSLSASNPTIDAMLRALTAAANVLRDHAAQCEHCRAFNDAMNRPLASELMTPRQGAQTPARPSSPAATRPMSPATLGGLGGKGGQAGPPSGARRHNPLDAERGASPTTHEAAADSAPVITKAEPKAVRLLRDRRILEKAAADQGYTRRMMPTAPTADGSKPAFSRGGRSVTSTGDEAAMPPRPVPPRPVREATARANRDPVKTAAASRVVHTNYVDSQYVRALFIRGQHAETDRKAKDLPQMRVDMVTQVQPAPPIAKKTRPAASTTPRRSPASSTSRQRQRSVSAHSGSRL